MTTAQDGGINIQHRKPRWMCAAYIVQYVV